jgi:hypothetical protein
MQFEYIHRKNNELLAMSRTFVQAWNSSCQTCFTEPHNIFFGIIPCCCRTASDFIFYQDFSVLLWQVLPSSIFRNSKVVPLHTVEVALNMMNGQLHTLATIFLGTELLVLFEYVAGWSSGPVWTLEKDKFLPRPGIE